MSYPDMDEAVKEISKRHGVPEEKVWEKIEDKIEPEAEDEDGRAKLGKILKMGGALGLAAALGFSVNEMARASPDPNREVITGRGMGTANNPFPQSHFESISTEQASIDRLANESLRSVRDPNKVALRFDDGYVSQYENAFKTLVEEGFTGTVFVVTRGIQDGSWANTNVNSSESPLRLNRFKRCIKQDGKSAHIHIPIIRPIRGLNLNLRMS